MSEKKEIGKVRRVIGDVFIALVVMFTAYLTVIMTKRISTVVLKGQYQQALVAELVVCGVFLILALDVRFGFLTKAHNKLLKGLGRAARIALAGIASLVLLFGGRVVAGSFTNTASDADKAIVLGLALENGMPTEDLIKRVDTGKAYLDEHPEATLILTGGNPDESGRTEAAVMRDLLVERGVSEDKMILEDKAENTFKNFANTAELVDSEEPVVIISSDYHMDRATEIAKRAGFSNILRLPAPSTVLNYGSNVMWEVLTEMTSFVLHR